MAVHAVLAEHVLRRYAVRQAIAVRWQAGVAGLRMAALAQHRSTHRKHAREIGTVRIMAIATVFGDRRMLPKIRSTLLGMAIEAGSVECLLRKLPFARITVGAVTTTAVHFALANRMGVRF